MTKTGIHSASASEWVFFADPSNPPNDQVCDSTHQPTVFTLMFSDQEVSFTCLSDELMDFGLCGLLNANYPLYPEHSIVKIQSPDSKSRVR